MADVRVAMSLSRSGERGGSEPAAPAPPPFVPQAVEVALGTSGKTLTLMTTDGSTFTLTLDDTTWSAARKMPEALWLALGTTGGMISIERLEDGSYQSNGGAIANGTVVPGGDATGATSTSIGRLGADGTQSAGVRVTIYGAFGAQVP